MSDNLVINLQLLKDTPLGELINGDDVALSNAAMKVESAFLAMDAGQITIASHHDYRLSGEFRQAVRELSDQVERSARDMAEQDQKNAVYAQADWDRNCAKEAELY